MTHQIAADAPTRPRHPNRSLIAAHDIRKSYAVGSGTVEILHGVSVQVAEQEMVAVMGPSGTRQVPPALLYRLAGLEAPTMGTVALAGHRPRASPGDRRPGQVRRRKVGFVFQVLQPDPDPDGHRERHAALHPRPRQAAGRDRGADPRRRRPDRTHGRPSGC